MTSRREFLSYLTATCGVLVAACAQPATTPAAPAAGGAATGGAGKSNGTKLTVWGYQSFTPEGDKALGDMMTAWGADNKTAVEYVVVENAQFPQKLAAAVEAKAPPDIAMLTGAGYVQDFASRDLFADVTDVWNDVSKQAGGFWKFIDPLYKVQNSYFGIPFEAETSPLFARLDLIQQATGARTLPKTLDEMTEVCKKINSPPNLYALGLTLGRTPDTLGNVINIIWNDGGALVDKDGKVALNTPQTVAAMKRIKGWWDAKIISPSSPTWDDTGNNAAFQSKQSAFVINPPSVYGWMVANDKDLLDNSTMAAVPAGTSGSYASSGAWSWSIFKATKNVDGAKELIRHLLDPARLQSIYNQVGGRWYPIHVDGQKHEFWTSKPQFKFYPDLLNGGRDNSWPAQPTAALLAAIGEVQTRLLIPDMVQNMIVKGTSPEEAVKAGHDAVVEVFKARGAPA